MSVKEKICKNCKEKFKPKTGNQVRCCNDACRKDYLVKYNKKYHAKYYIENKDEIKKKVSTYRVGNKPKINEYRRRKHKENPEVVNSRYREYKKKRQLIDIAFLINRTIRRRIHTALSRRYTQKKFNTIELIGCSIPELQNHIQSLFNKGMTWENYGLHGWHIDHITPCSAFDLTKPEEQKTCFHYTNMQPLWAIDNLKKSDKLNWKG